MNSCRQRGSFWLITGSAHCAPPLPAPPDDVALPDDEVPVAVAVPVRVVVDDCGLPGTVARSPTRVTCDADVQQTMGWRAGWKSSAGYCSCSTVLPPPASAAQMRNVYGWLSSA